MGKFTARVCKRGLGVRGRPGILCVQPPRLESPRPPPRASLPAGRGAPQPRAPRAAPYPAERPGLALSVLEALTCEHWGPWPGPAGNFPNLLASIAAAAAAGWLCVCARMRVCVRLCMRLAGGRAGSAERLLLSPAGDAAACSCGRLTGGCWPRRSQSHLSRSQRPASPNRNNSRAAGARGSRIGSGSGARALAVVLNGQLRAPSARRGHRPVLRRCRCSHSFSALHPHVMATPWRPRLHSGPTPSPCPHPSPGDSCYCHPPSSQSSSRVLPAVTFPHRVSGGSGKGRNWRNRGVPPLGT